MQCLAIHLLANVVKLTRVVIDACCPHSNVVNSGLHDGSTPISIICKEFTGILSSEINVAILQSVVERQCDE